MANRNRKQTHRQKPKKKLPPTVFDLQNTPFGRVVFYEKNKREHLFRHPELEDQEFIQKVQEAILHPELVFRSLNFPYNKLIIYNKLDEMRSPINPKLARIRYTMVVLGTNSKVLGVATAFKRDYIKEKRRIQPNEHGYYY